MTESTKIDNPIMVESFSTPPGWPVINMYGAKVLLDEKQALDLSPFLNLANTRVEKGSIYGQTLSQFVAQLSILSQILGSVDVLEMALEGSEHKPTEEDKRVHANLQHSIDLVAEVILEKFSPRPR